MNNNLVEGTKPFIEASSAELELKLIDKKVKSEYTQQYHQFLWESKLSQAEVDQLIEKMSRQQEIQYCQHRFQSQLRIQIVQYSPDQRIVVLKVYLGYFQLTIWVYNDGGQSPIHYCRHLPARENTMIYFTYSRGVHQTVKCHEFNSNQKTVEVFLRALRQCCFLKVASVLGVGPKYTKFSQFDLIIYDHCVEFAMEECCQISKAVSRLTERQVGCLKRKLSILHHFKLIHLDIKPGNIMYSRAIRQPVFIDYGFSKVVQEEVGYKSLTQCAGSLEYCCPQMRAGLIGLQQSTRNIDLYFNDAHCLQTSISEMQEEQTHQSISSSLEEDIDILIPPKDYVEYYLMLQIKQRLFRRQRVIGNPDYECILKKHHSQFFDFLINLPYCIPLIEVHNFMISNKAIKDDERYNLSIMMKHKLIKMFKLQQPHVEADNLFLAKLQLSSAEPEIQLTLQGHVRIVCFEDYKPKLTNSENINKLTRNQYYRMLLKCLDFRCSLSSIADKRNYAAMFIKLQKIQAQANESQDSLGLISLVFKAILNHFIRTQEEQFQTIVPAAITNLVIIEAFTRSELLDMIERVRQMKINPLKTAIMLFKCSELLHWISLKVYSEYSDLDLELSIKEVILSGLKEIKDTEYGWLARMIKDTICYDKEFSLEQSKELVALVSSCKDISREVSDDLVGLTIYEMNKAKWDHQVMSHTNAILNLYILNHKIFDGKKIRPIHIQILCNSNHQSHHQILEKVTQQLAACLQEPKLLCQFKSFYKKDHILFSKDPVERVQRLWEVAQNKGYRYSNQFLVMFVKLIFDTKYQPQWSKVIEIAKNIFDLRYLKQLVFPSHKKFSNFQVFFEKVVHIFLVYYQIYCQSHSQQILYLAVVLDQLRAYHNQIQCQPCKESCYHLIRKMEIFQCTSHKRYDDILNICLIEIEKLVSNERFKLANNGTFAMYLERLVRIFSEQEIEASIESNFKKIIYLIIKNNNCYSIVFVTQASHMIYSFLTDYIIFQAPQPDLQILHFHKQLTDFLYCYPQKQFVVFYQEIVRKWLETHRNLLQLNAQLIISQFFEAPSHFNCNFALLLSYLLRLLDKKSPYFRKTAANVCRSADIAILHLKYCALQNLFSDLSVLKQLAPSIRKRERLILRFIQYFNGKASFNEFISYLGLKQIKKRAASDSYDLNLLQKLTLLYQNRLSQ